MWLQDNMPETTDQKLNELEITENVGRYIGLREKLGKGEATDEEKNEIIQLLSKIPINFDAGYSAFKYNMQIMSQISHEMKEIPELPSEAPKDVHPLHRVEFPEEGGMLTYMEGQEYPYRGFPYYDFVDRIDIFKKTGRAFISGFYHKIKKGGKLRLVTLVPAIWIFRDFFSVGIYVFYRLIDRFKLKTIRYCRALQEIYRVFSLPRQGENEETTEFRLMLRDLTCMFLEFDNAYRFRVQDIIEELNQINIVKNPRKELCRLLDIMSSRELTQEVKDSWTLMKMFVKYYLLLDRRLLKIIVDVLSRLDVERVKLTIEDKSYCRPRKDFICGFMLKERENKLN